MELCTAISHIPAQAGSSTHYACVSGILPYLVQIQWSPVYLQWRRSGFFQILIHPFSGKESKWMCAGNESNRMVTVLTLPSEYFRFVSAFGVKGFQLSAGGTDYEVNNVRLG